MQSRERTGGSNWPASRTASPLFWFWDMGRMQWLQFYPSVDTPAHLPSGTSDTVPSSAHFFGLAVATRTSGTPGLQPPAAPNKWNERVTNCYKPYGEEKALC